MKSSASLGRAARSKRSKSRSGWSSHSRTEKQYTCSAVRAVLLWRLIFSSWAGVGVPPGPRALDFVTFT